MSVLGHDIRQWVTWYATGDVSLLEFQDWFVPRAWAIAADNPEDGDLAHEIELRLAEFSNGHWTESELRGQLENVAAFSPARLIAAHASVPVHFGGTRTASQSAGRTLDLWRVPVVLAPVMSGTMTDAA